MDRIRVGVLGLQGDVFHPELSQDIRIHQFFIDMVRDHKRGSID